MELHTESHDGQTDGSTSEAVGKIHHNVCALYTPQMRVKQKSSRAWGAASGWVAWSRIGSLGDSEIRNKILRCGLSS